MTYTQSEIDSIKALYLDLVAYNHIKIDELDAWRNPIPLYTAEAKRRLITVIAFCSGFDWSGVIENASLAVTADMRDYMVAAFQGRVGSAGMLNTYGDRMAAEINKAALLELTESLFTPAQIIEMLVTHVDYLDLVQDAIRRGRVEDDDMKDRHFALVREHAA